MAVCRHRDKWTSHRSYLGTGQMEVIHAELRGIGLALEDTIENREILQGNRVKMVEVVNDSQAAIPWAAHLEPGPGQWLPRRMNRKAQALPAHGIKTEIHWVPGHSSIPRIEDADCEANVAREARGDTPLESPYT